MLPEVSSVSICKNGIHALELDQIGPSEIVHNFSDLMPHTFRMCICLLQESYSTLCVCVLAVTCTPYL